MQKLFSIWLSIYNKTKALLPNKRITSTAIDSNNNCVTVKNISLKEDRRTDMEKYIKPELELQKFEAVDVLNSSNNWGESGGGNGGFDDE